MQEKYNIIESCDEMIGNNKHPNITTVSQYFGYIYTNPETVYKYVCQYGKWNKPGHRKKIVDQLLGKDFEAKGKITKSDFHEIETLLYAEIVTKRKFSRRVLIPSFVFVPYNSSSNEKKVAIYKDHNVKVSNG